MKLPVRRVPTFYAIVAANARAASRPIEDFSPTKPRRAVRSGAVKTVKIDTSLPELPDDAPALLVAQYVVARLFHIRHGALFGRWDDAKGEGIWFHCRETKAMFDSVTVDEVIFRERDRCRFRSVIFRIGSLAAETPGDLCGILRLLPNDPAVDPGPERHCYVHASFEPEAGLWLKAAVVNVGGFV